MILKALHLINNIDMTVIKLQKNKTAKEAKDNKTSTSDKASIVKRCRLSLIEVPIIFRINIVSIFFCFYTLVVEFFKLFQ